MTYRTFHAIQRIKDFASPEKLFKLTCILVEWERNKGTTNKVGMSTLEDIMSENITNAEHTMFYLVHKHMKTMQRIDQPITIEKPKYLKENLVKIQDYHKEIVKYINHFLHYIEEARKQAAEDYENSREWVERALQRRERKQNSARRASNQQSQNKQEPAPNAEEAAPAPAQKRRRIAPNRLNIASTKCISYR